MLPTLRKRLKTISDGNKGLQDILRSMQEGTEILSVESYNGKVHNTKITLLIDKGSNYPKQERYVERVHFYNRVALNKVIPANAVYPKTTVEDAIEVLNLQYGCDFTLDDVELIDGELKSKRESLGYYGESQASEESETITAVYDSFYQTMTVTGSAGLAVQTLDSDNNVLGSGMIGSNGTVTYPINEDNHDRSVPIFTSSENSNVVEHNLTVSFYAEMNDAHLDPGEYDPWVMFVKEILQSDEQTTNSWDHIQFDENATGRIYVQWNWNELESIKIYTMDEIRAQFTERYGADFYPDDELYSVTSSTTAPTLKVRFDVDTPIILGLANTDIIHQFYDDGSAIKTIGYRFCIDYTGQHPLRKVPTYLPKSIKNLDFMFASGGLQMFENEAGAANLNLWDVGHIVTMNSTFAETDDSVIPISNWRPVNVTSMARFMSATACLGGGVSDISAWHTPLLSNINEAFIKRYNTLGYVADLSQWCVPLIPTEPTEWHSGQMIPPVWGTCPNL